MWKFGRQRPEEIPHLLLNSYFAEIELEKQRIVAATSPALNGHGNGKQNNNVNQVWDCIP
jgi:hypothetical protein